LHPHPWRPPEAQVAPPHAAAVEACLLLMGALPQARGARARNGCQAPTPVDAGLVKANVEVSAEVAHVKVRRRLLAGAARRAPPAYLPVSLRYMIMSWIEVMTSCRPPQHTHAHKHTYTRTHAEPSSATRGGERRALLAEEVGRGSGGSREGDRKRARECESERVQIRWGL